MTSSSHPQAYARAPRDPAAWLRDMELQMTIDGVAAGASDRQAVVDPCTETRLVDCPEGDVGHLNRAVDAASRAFAGWAATPWDERRAALNRLADALADARESLAFIITSETGRPLWRALNEAELAIAYLRTLAAVDLGPRRLDRDGLKVELRRKPLGVACAIAPWNSPVVLAIAKIANALIAGDTLVLKPSPFTPLSALYMGQLARSVLPPGVLNVITGGAAVGAGMAAHPGVAKLSFTGSTAVGKLIAAAGAPSLKRLTLELGGNDAAIVLADADPQAVAEAVNNVSLANVGQFCAAIKRLYVHEALYDEVRAAIVAKADATVQGPGFDPLSDMGPVQNRLQFERVTSLLDDAVRRGARVLTDGGQAASPGLFIRPTLVEGVGHGVALVDEEQFGPVLPLMRFSDEDEVVALANDSAYGLGGSVWTADVERGVAVADRLQVGTAWINQHGAFTAALPMPFARDSGLGTDYAEYGVLEHTRAMLINAKTLPNRPAAPALEAAR